MKIKSLALLSSIVLLVGCDEESITNSMNESKEKSTITMKVVDSKTLLPIDSAEVYSVLKKNSLYSDKEGLVTWKDNVIGDYDYIVSKEGYASQRADLKVVETGMGSTARVADNILSVPLHKVGVTVKGTVLLRDSKTGNRSAASKIPVVIKYDEDSQIYPAELETMTDASGVFSFDSLAENVQYQIVVPQAEIDGQTYEIVDAGNLVIPGLRAGEAYSMSPVTMEVVGLLPELIRTNFSTLDTIDEQADIYLTFSTNLLADSVSNAWKVFKSGNVVDNKCSGGIEVLVASKLLSNGKTVMINSVSNKWNRATYCLEGSVYTTEGRSKEFAMLFNPGALSERPSNVINLNWDDTEYKLSWTVEKSEIPGLSGYRIFYKTNSMADYRQFRDIADNKTTEITIYYMNDDRFVDATYAYFYVLPYAEINGKVVTSDVSDENLKPKKIVFE